MTLKICAAAALCAASGIASAALVVESEPNDVIAMANDLGTFGPPGDAVVIDGTITGGDVDWFEFTITSASPLTVAAAFDPTLAGDGQMMLVDSSGVVLAFDDDSNIGLMPSLQITGLTAGTYYIGISGFADVGIFDDPTGTTDIFDGLQDDGSAHGEEFMYKMTLGMNIVPTPASAALLGLGGLCMVRRRR
ncbi:MAG: pre-peptidase C-terminal domain-containing protein [Planctomycetota bacterium]